MAVRGDAARVLGADLEEHAHHGRPQRVLGDREAGLLDGALDERRRRLDGRRVVQAGQRGVVAAVEADHLVAALVRGELHVELAVGGDGDRERRERAERVQQAARRHGDALLLVGAVALEAHRHALHDGDLQVGGGDLEVVAVALEEHALEDGQRALAGHGAVDGSEGLAELGAGDGELHRIGRGDQGSIGRRGGKDKRLSVRVSSDWVGVRSFTANPEATVGRSRRRRRRPTTSIRLPILLSSRSTSGMTDQGEARDRLAP